MKKIGRTFPERVKPRQRGTAIIEFAFAVVLLLLLAVGITELGRAFWYYSAMQKAARDGARCASYNVDIGDCVDLAQQDVDAAVGAGRVSVVPDTATAGYITFTLTYDDMRILWFGGSGWAGGVPTLSLQATATMPDMK